MSAAITLLTTTLPTIVASGVILQTVDRVFPKSGQGSGRAIAHWHRKGRNQAVMHKHPGGDIPHQHKGMPGYGMGKALDKNVVTKAKYD